MNYAVEPSEAAGMSAKRLERKDLLELIATRLPLSDLPLFAKGTFAWSKPVYAVWGNHEDADVLRRLREGALAVPNLHLLDEVRVQRVGPLRKIVYRVPCPSNTIRSFFAIVPAR